MKKPPVGATLAVAREVVAGIQRAGASPAPTHHPVAGSMNLMYDQIS